MNSIALSPNSTPNYHQAQGRAGVHVAQGETKEHSVFGQDRSAAPGVARSVSPGQELRAVARAGKLVTAMMNG